MTDAPGKLTFAAGRSSLGQYGRAGVDALGSMQVFASSALRDAAERAFDADADGRALHEGPAGDAGAAEIMEWVERATEVANRHGSYRWERFFQGYVARAIYDFGIPAVEARRDHFPVPPAPAQADAGEAAEGAPALPDYFERDWHLRPGGWDAYDLYGPHGLHVIGPIFRLGGFAAVPVGAEIGRHRIDVASQLPRRDYRRIYEPGCGNATTLIALRSVFPEAALVGSDLSLEQLRGARMLLQRFGVEADLRHRDATSSGEADGSFDAVAIFALNHELPVETSIALFREMYRILAPGGDIVISDPPPFRAVGPFHAALLHWDTANRGEPYFSDAGAADWARELAAIGFVDVAARPLGPASYPWVTIARKPARGR
ncbi:class I SAM-dependent methyltransferase [Novosphingobium sp. BL-52-GroH]|uniref:class I SAM-dependent methyltransferase n=1 Tax=Novosphingobium sp. BL-52-GroH TaxID=3349877 RepID=UPI00384C9A1B